MTYLLDRDDFYLTQQDKLSNDVQNDKRIFHIDKKRNRSAVS